MLKKQTSVLIIPWVSRFIGNIKGPDVRWQMLRKFIGFDGQDVVCLETFSFFLSVLRTQIFGTEAAVYFELTFWT